MKTNAMSWAGYGLSGLAVAFLLLDAGMKIAEAPLSMQFTTALGFTAAMVRPIGLILLACTLLYAFPRTAVLGAILLTGYLGGAIAVHLLHRDPLLTHVLFGVGVGMFVWGGLFFRSETVRSLIPFVARN